MSFNKIFDLTAINRVYFNFHNMYTCNCHFLFFGGHISSRSHLSAKRQMRWAQFDRWGHVAGGLGAIRAVCRAWQALIYFFGLGHKANPLACETSPGKDGVSAYPRGLGLCIPPGIGCTHPPGDWVFASPIPV